MAGRAGQKAAAGGWAAMAHTLPPTKPSVLSSKLRATYTAPCKCGPDDMEMWPVTAAVGNVKNTGAELIEPTGATIIGAELVSDLT